MPAALTLGYFRFLTTGEKVEFQYNPETLKLAIQATWAARTTHGGSHPRRHYQHTEGRPFEVELMFVARELDAADLEQTRRLLESMPFPEYDTSGRLASGPEPVVFAFGGWRAFRCLVAGVTLEPGPSFDPETTRPRMLSVKVSLEEAPLDGDLGASDVRGGR